MFGLFEKNDPELQKAIDRIYEEMTVYGPDSPEYSAMLTHLERLNELKSKSSHRRVSPDTMAIVAGNLAGILVIVAYEQKHVMTSKGLGFVNLKTKP